MATGDVFTNAGAGYAADKVATALGTGFAFHTGIGTASPAQSDSDVGTGTGCPAKAVPGTPANSRLNYGPAAAATGTSGNGTVNLAGITPVTLNVPTGSYLKFAGDSTLYTVTTGQSASGGSITALAISPVLATSPSGALLAQIDTLVGNVPFVSSLAITELATFGDATTGPILTHHVFGAINVTSGDSITFSVVLASTPSGP